MARRRTQNIRDLRAQYDAAERRKQEDDEVEGDEEETDEADEEIEAGEDEAEAEAEGDEDEEAEEVVVKKKKKPVKEAKPKRVRTPKQVRQKVVWGVFNNSNQRVATFDYPRKQEAEEHAAKLQTDKKSTFFVQPVKEPIEEKKE